MKTTRNLLLLAALAVMFGASASASCVPAITLDNQSGEPALVKLVGPTAGTVAVPAGASRAVSAAGGGYYILVRYGAAGHYRYTRGDSFTVTQRTTYGGSQCSRITITLHVVANGNYGSRSSSAGEFGGASE